MTPDLREAVVRHNWEAVTFPLALPGSRLRERPGLRFVDSGTAVPFLNGVASLDLADGADAAVAEVTAVLRDRGVPAMWWPLPSGSPADLPARLEAAGWKHTESMPWMGRGLDVALPVGPDVPGLEVRRVVTDEDQAAWFVAMRDGFGIPAPIMDALARVGSAMGTGGPWLRFVALLHGRPVGSAGVHLTGDVAGLYNVTTLPSLRRRGVGTAATLAALGQMRDHGARIAVLGTTEMGRSIYERLGFRHVVDLDVFTLAPS
jgi:ribosomal protein S18 acetylase RimI-like enzyme